MFARAGLAAVAVSIFLGARLFRRGTPWSAFAIMGVLNNAVPFTLIFWGQTEIASGLAAILNATAHISPWSSPVS